MSPRSARRTQLPDEVAAYVRDLIVSGKVQPGEFLRMEPISEAVGVSNTPVREGLLNLRSEGFVELVPRRGFVVAGFSRQDVHDLFWAQAQLAGELAARAAKIATPEFIEQLERLIDEFEAARVRGDQDTLSELGHQFHRTINLAANSRRLTALLGAMVNQLPRSFYAEIEGNDTEATAHHKILVEAFRKRQVRKVRSLMEEHILASADRLAVFLEKQGLWGPAEATAERSA